MKILFLDKVHSILQDRLEEKGFTCIQSYSSNIDDTIKLLHSCDGIVIRSRFRMDESLLKHAPGLKFIARSGAGMENIDEEYCSNRGIELFNAPEGNRNAVGEHALGMILALFNKMHTADRDVRTGKWQREHNRGLELDGKTIGLIGYGNNSAAFAKKLQGFDVSILAYDKYKSNFGTEFVKEAEMNELFENVDILSFHIPQNAETIQLGSRSFFNKFKNEIYVINLSRGKIIDTSALVELMKSKRILGACLDVLEYEKSSFEQFFDQELNSDFQYLLESENVILSPHVAGWTKESYFKLSNVLADKILLRF